MPRPKAVNPFYVLLMLTGVVFAITACAYGVMTVKFLDPWQLPEGQADSGVLAWLDRYGLYLLAGELAVLGILTAAAMLTDDFWSRRAAEESTSTAKTTEETRS